MSAVSGSGLSGPVYVIDTARPGSPPHPEPAEWIWPHRSLPEIVTPGSGRAGMPEPVYYDLNRPHLRARERVVAERVAAAKAEAARRHARWLAAQGG